MMKSLIPPLVALGIVLLGVNLVPGSMVFDVWMLKYETESGRVLQGREVMLPNMLGNWQAQVVDKDYKVACSGSGQWVYEQTPEKDSSVPKAILLNDWTGDSHCTDKLEEQRLYQLKAAWKFDFLLTSFTIRKESDWFTYSSPRAYVVEQQSMLGEIDFSDIR